MLIATAFGVTVGLGGCGGSGVDSSSQRSAPPYFLALREAPDGLLELELCSVKTGRVVQPDFGEPGVYATNGAAMSPDGREAYVAVTEAGHPYAIERAPTDGGKHPTVVADGEWPSISPNGRLLAYVKPNPSMLWGDGPGGTVVVVRDLATGNTRSINLRPLIGDGMLHAESTTNGFMTWMANGADLAVIPMAKPILSWGQKLPPVVPSPCFKRGGATGCVVVVRAGSQSRPLSVRRYAVPTAAVRNVETVAPVAHDPRALVTAGGPRIDRIELKARAATVEQLWSPPHEPVLELDAFNNSGSALLYTLGDALNHVWKADVPTKRTSSVTERKVAGKACVFPLAW